MPTQPDWSPSIYDVVVCVAIYHCGWFLVECGGGGERFEEFSAFLDDCDDLELRFTGCPIGSWTYYMVMVFLHYLWNTSNKLNHTQSTSSWVTLLAAECTIPQREMYNSRDSTQQHRTTLARVASYSREPGKFVAFEMM